jgi:hypothetical protein
VTAVEDINFLPHEGSRGRPHTVGYRIEPDSGCWLWTGFITKRGYPRATRGGKNSWAHRAVYEQLVGPIPPDCDLHHLCENRACVNPDHLQPRLASEHRGRPGSLTVDQLELLWDLLGERVPLDEIADRIGVSRRFIRNVKLQTVYEPRRLREP